MIPQLAAAIGGTETTVFIAGRGGSPLGVVTATFGRRGLNFTSIKHKL